MSIKIPTFNEMIMVYGHQFTELEIGDAYRIGDYYMLVTRLKKEKNMKDENLKEKREADLFHKIIKDGYRIDMTANTIFIPYTEVDNINKNILILRNEFGYSIQSEII